MLSCNHFCCPSSFAISNHHREETSARAESIYLFLLQALGPLNWVFSNGWSCLRLPDFLTAIRMFFLQLAVGLVLSSFFMRVFVFVLKAVDAVKLCEDSSCICLCFTSSKHMASRCPDPEMYLEVGDIQRLCKCQVGKYWISHVSQRHLCDFPYLKEKDFHILLLPQHTFAPFISRVNSDPQCTSNRMSCL